MEKEKSIEEIENMISKVSSMNRSERRNRYRYYMKLLKKHMEHKPKIRTDLNEEDEKKQLDKVRNWGTRYMTLNRKLGELNYVNQENRRGMGQSRPIENESSESGEGKDI